MALFCTDETTGDANNGWEKTEGVNHRLSAADIITRPSPNYCIKNHNINNIYTQLHVYLLLWIHCWHISVREYHSKRFY